MQQTRGTGISQQIRARYGSNRGGKSYGQIAREFGVSRALVHAVLTKPLHPRPQREQKSLPRRSPVLRRRRTGAMRALVVRFPTEDVIRLRIEANTRGQTISALLRDILIPYCQQLQENRR